MREMSVAEQRYKAVLAVIADGRTMSEATRDLDVSRQTVHASQAHYEREGLEGLDNRAPDYAFGAEDAQANGQQAALDILVDVCRHAWGSHPCCGTFDSCGCRATIGVRSRGRCRD